jgi:hypothetical protein
MAKEGYVEVDEEDLFLAIDAIGLIARDCLSEANKCQDGPSKQIFMESYEKWNQLADRLDLLAEREV